MKILEEIVDYLALRGAVTPEEVVALEIAGFIRSQAERDPWAREDDPDLHDPPDVHEESLPPGRARPHPRRSKRAPLKAPAIAARLRAVLRAAEPHLGAIASIAPVEGRASRWDRIPMIARAAPSALAASIPPAIASGSTSFRALWDAIGADEHLGAVRPGEHGPAATAYRALIAIGDHREIGKHLWILRRRAVSRCYELMRAQDRAVEGIHAVYRRDPALVGKWIAHEPHPVAYWSFVLLYNAERAARGTPWDPFAGEQPARRRPPSPLDFSRAWARAIQLGGAPVSRFLKAYWAAEVTSRRLWTTLSPPDSPRAYSEDWLRAALASNPALAAGHGPHLLEAMRALRRLDLAPAQRLAEAHLATPAAVSPPSFGEDRGRRPSPLVGGPIPGSAHVALFCPSGWN